MEKPQFDKLLGGNVHLPRDVQISKFVAARASEIAAMTYSINNPQQTKLVFQKLPIHMRRRVMSHNAKRMPRRLREAHTRQMEKSGLAPKSKTPSRKHRRRPNNLLQEYNRRQRKKKWLETHIWHAKRFHMCEKWGFKIADYSNNRGYRASYRAVAQYCAIQDISYYICIELKGPENILIEKLKNHCCKDKLTFGAKAFLDGGREGSLEFYKKDGSPVGKLTFMWNPDKTEKRSIWLWTHPSFHQTILDELVSNFNFHEALEKSPEESREFFSDQTECKMTIISNSLNRFRLRGPLTVAVLNDTLRFVSKSLQAEILELEKMEIDSTETSEMSWHESWYKDKNHFLSLKVQQDTFSIVKTFNSSSQFPRHGILALTVLDPRFFLPQKPIMQEHSQKVSMNASYIHKFEKNASESPLWEIDVRMKTKTNCKSTNEINKIRSKNLVPGVDNDLELNEKIISKVPVILIQYPGTDVAQKSLGFSSGIDIILPAGWALPFWLAFMYRCARPVGLREYKSIVFESLLLDCPEINHPDTDAYLQEAKETKNNLMKKYFQYPPNRRVNFTKFSISSPFYCEWKILVNEWTNENHVHVLKIQKLIRMLDQALNNFSGPPRRVRKSSSTIHREKFDRSALEKEKSSLVLVKITIEGRGKPKNFSLICKPTDEDVQKFITNKKWSGPVQKLKADPFEKQRKEIRQNHRVFLKRAMRQRSRSKKDNKPAIQYRSEEEKMKFSQIMKELYLPECKTVKNSCDREVMGYVVQGDFSFTESKGVGWGYVIAQTLLELIDRKNCFVLIRNTQTRQYRRAKINVVNFFP